MEGMDRAVFQRLSTCSILCICGEMAPNQSKEQSLEGLAHVCPP